MARPDGLNPDSQPGKSQRCSSKPPEFSLRRGVGQPHRPGRMVVSSGSRAVPRAEGGVLSTMPEWFAALICARLGKLPIQTGGTAGQQAIIVSASNHDAAPMQLNPPFYSDLLSSMSLHVWTRLWPDGSHWAADGPPWWRLGIGTTPGTCM